MKKKENFLVFILLFFSGNPLPFLLFGKYSSLIALLFTVSILKSNFKIDTDFSNKLKLILFTILIIVLLQYVTLASLSSLAFGNIVLKIIMGGLILNYLKEKFAYVFFRVISALSLISLFGFIIINLSGLDLPYIKIGPFYKSFFLYGSLPGEALLRNCGMFWEPGAFAGILTLCLALNFKYLNYYWVNYKLQLIYIFFALLTTQSTTGYIVVFFIFLFNLINYKNFFQRIILIFTFLFISFYIYNKTNFLKTKLDNQFFKASNQRIGSFSNSRFGSIIFDLHYISKHPFSGNGFNFKTRYADHQFLFRGASEKTDVIGSGNGFFSFLASMGVFFIILYFYLLWETSKTIGNKFAFFICLIVFLNLQGEQFFNYPLYLSLPFIIFDKPILI